MRAQTLILAVFTSVITLVACNRDRPEDAVQTPPAAESTAQPLRVTQVDLGKAVGADKRVSTPATEFTPTETVFASVVTEGNAPNATLVARWTFQDGQVVDESSQTIAPTGTAVTEFHISKPDGFPKGKYRVEILLNGASVQTKDFEVK
jgi:hypothetical protein